VEEQRQSPLWRLQHILARFEPIGASLRAAKILSGLSMKQLFKPILAGATLRDRMRACAGGIIGIALTSLLAWLLLDDWASAPMIVAPMGASAVLVFAIPASPLAQPWPVIGGNTISALVGVFFAQTVTSPHLAAGLAVGFAILLMSLARCLHPPGGAAALTAVIGGPIVASAGYSFAFLPIAMNAVCLVLVGIAYHFLSGHSYPHRPQAFMGQRISERDLAPPHEEDISAALADLGETFDIGPEDLELIIRRVDFHAAQRREATR